ncbi:MAG: hypothetical protein QF845_04550 [Candidatus Marinimicrobia bacterium]|nr:hypothetical protein [Candidatus Neomarinimicrobiota bacterium]
MINALFKRRWWLTQNRIFSTLGFALMLPLLIYTMVFMVLNTIIGKSVNGIPYSEWAFPGCIVLIGASALMPLLFRDFFDLRVHGRVLLNLTLSPSSKTGLVAGILLTGLAESLVFSAAAGGVLLVLINTSFGAVDFLLILAFAAVFNIMLGNIIIMLSLLIDRVSLFMFSILALFIWITFGSGLLIELGYYPESVGAVLEFLPTALVVRGFHSILFLNYLDGILIAVPILLGIVWTFLNGFILKRKLNQ